MSTKRGARVWTTRAPDTSAAADAPEACTPAPLPSRKARRLLESPLLLLRCAQCQGVFFLCQRCYRGQRTCGPACQQQRRVEQRRAARRRHRRSEEGKLDHRDAERGRRARRRAQTRSATPQGVGDQGSPAPGGWGSVSAQPAPSLAPPRRRSPDAKPNAPSLRPAPRSRPARAAWPRCRQCDTHSRWVVHPRGGRLRPRASAGDPP